LIAIFSYSDLEMILSGLTTLRILKVFSLDILLARVEPSRARLDKADKTITKSKEFSKFLR